MTRRAGQFVSVLLSSALLVSGCQQQGDAVREYRYGGSSGGGSLGTHTLHTGENLWQVAQAYQVELRSLIDANQLSAPYRLPVGARLQIPAPRTYTVRSGDAVYGVSRIFNTTTTALVKLNKIPKPYTLKVGQTLRVSGNGQVAVTTTRNEAAPVQIMPRIEHHGQIERVALPSITSPPEQVQVKEQAQNPTQPAVLSTDTHGIPGKGFLRPVGGRVLSGYGPKKDGMHNDGINIKAMRGEGVRAAQSGQVVYAGDAIDGYGNLILIRHTNGYVTAYAHLDKMLVKKGDAIKRGQVVGKVGSTGHVSEPQLHFEIRQGKEALNPAPLIGKI